MHVAPPIEGLCRPKSTTLPIDKVRFQGDLVACVVATDRYLAEDAAERIEVEYEPLGVVADMGRRSPTALPLVDESVPGNLLSDQTFSNGDVAARAARPTAWSKPSFSQHRQTHMPIETRGCAAIWDEGREHLTFHVGTQVPHPLRTQLARRLRLSESQVTVLCPDVGGGFGQKIALYREELTVAALART